ncbi:MAG: 30S ribosomal protein S8 [Candidatus Buchananbacteria bacterium RIFCSPLOWO2_01_FULL_56_15]|uniref:Small ribosomal subunit protein uS8 n=3 Tax=Candidatus Buchananiibacteriota TaxID=1817903 RepID=A0A1G1YJC1_9BACT|nr:MAG: 30S ribosomal protein S8 [Candidatus Buchananbacteria bacterium RIFCSPHIGHO2_02_FULL_56_16]OGY54900.1 MAG: 30S ribosomal protein S8 [Candidatus Buchananbacteria bacterium RIFCSPLOWO2_01_FULL_56_15]
MTDPIADMLTRIRNALAVRKTEVVLPYSKLKFNVAEILRTEGFVRKVEKIAKGTADNRIDQLRIVLKYLGPKEPAIAAIKRISKPGQRVYVTKDNIPVVLNNLGIAIISTSSGLMTNRQARKRGVGGEVICEVY